MYSFGGKKYFSTLFCRFFKCKTHNLATFYTLDKGKRDLKVKK